MSRPADLSFNPADPAMIENPVPFLRHLQDVDPVHWSGHMRSWIITRYDDVKRIQSNKDISADRLTPFFERLPDERRTVIADLIRYLNTWIAFKDPPDHTRLRQLLIKTFTPSRVKHLRPRIEELVRHLLDGLEDRADFDFISEFAFPLPAQVIMSMMGIPFADMADLKHWSDMMQPFIGNASASPDKYERAGRGAVAMADYFRGLVADRAKNPGDDLISLLRALRDEDDKLTEDEVIGTCMLFLFGGHETTTNLIGNGMRALLQNPDQLALLQRDPGLIKSAVEEFLRFDGPTGGVVRVVKVTHDWHGKTMHKGERVYAMVNAANHDASVFERPEILDIRRSPNPHLTFNHGIHFCLGAPLARLEGEIAIGEAVKRFPRLQQTGGPVTYMDTLVMRGARSMPVHNPDAGGQGRKTV